MTFPARVFQKLARDSSARPTRLLDLHFTFSRDVFPCFLRFKPFNRVNDPSQYPRQKALYQFKHMIVQYPPSESEYRARLPVASLKTSPKDVNRPGLDPETGEIYHLKFRRNDSASSRFPAKRRRSKNPQNFRKAGWGGIGNREMLCGAEFEKFMRKRTSTPKLVTSLEVSINSMWGQARIPTCTNHS